jgi:homoserine O-acetyltransferase
MARFQMTDFTLKSGAVLPELQIAYECYGQMSSGRDNLILVAHGTTSSHHAVGVATPDRRRGWWDTIVGPGELFDTNRFCIISSNMLGSSYGSTGPTSINPATGRLYGPDFPTIEMEDIVQSQFLMLKALGVERLVAVAGSSVGGFQALQWAVMFPDFMGGVIALDTATRALGEGAASVDALIANLEKDPAWNGGHYHKGRMEETLFAIRIATLESYGIEAHLTDSPGNVPSERTLEQTAHAWAREFDANSLILLNRTIARFDIEEQLHQIRAPLLYVMADTDEWFPVRVGRRVASRFSALGLDATYVEIASRHGHYATTIEPEKWVPAAKAFLSRVASRTARREV